MIVIAGASRDDILYFNTILKGKHRDTILGRYEIVTGTIFNQDILLVNEQYTGVLSSAVMMNILNNYFVDLVVIVGKCVTLDNRLKSGDIVVSNKVIDANVNLTMYSNSRVGEIPGYERDLMIQNDLIKYLKDGLSKKSYNTAKEAIFLSSDNLGEIYLKQLSSSQGLFGIRNEHVVYDYNSSGIGMACVLKDTPFISIKVIERQMDQKEDVNRYLKVLDSYVDLGKAVANMIGEIGRTDILSGDENYDQEQR